MIDDLINAVDTWQNAGFFHELTCGRNSNHRPLRAKKSGDNVILYCQDCDYTQDDIPEVILKSYRNGFHIKMKKLLEDFK